MTTPRLTEAELGRLEELLSKATAGPWQWHLSHDGLSLRTPDRGQLIIMDVGRTGDIRFAKRTDKDRGGLLCDSKEFLPQPMRVGFCTLDNPDASLIPAMVNAAPALLSMARDYALAFNQGQNEALRKVAEVLGTAMPTYHNVLGNIQTLTAERDRLAEALQNFENVAHDCMGCGHVLNAACARVVRWHAEPKKIDSTSYVADDLNTIVSERNKIHAALVGAATIARTALEGT